MFDIDISRGKEKEFFGEKYLILKSVGIPGFYLGVSKKVFMLGNDEFGPIDVKLLIDVEECERFNKLQDTLDEEYNAPSV